METFDDIVKKNVNLVIDKGYDDKSLNSFLGIDHFATIFEENLVRAIQKAELEMSAQYYNVSLNGVYNRDTDIVHFDFRYCYQYPGNTVSFDGLIGRMREEFVGFNIPESKTKLPGADVVYKALLQKEEARLKLPVKVPDRTNPNFTRTDLLMDTLRFEVKTLLHKGFLNPNVNNLLNPYAFFNHLKDEMKIIISRENKLPDLIITGNSFTNTKNTNNLNIRLAYKFDPQPVSLHFYGVIGQLEDQRHVLMPGDSTNLPHYEKLYEDLLKMQQVSKAKQLFDQMSYRQSIGKTQKKNL